MPETELKGCEQMHQVTSDNITEFEIKWIYHHPGTTFEARELFLANHIFSNAKQMSVTETKGCEQIHQVYIRKPQRKYHYKQWSYFKQVYLLMSKICLRWDEGLRIDRTDNFLDLISQSAVKKSGSFMICVLTLIFEF